jgi:hypothetical protein
MSSYIVDFAGDANLRSRDITVTRDATISGNVTIARDATVTGNVTIARDATVTGNVTSQYGNVGIGTTEPDTKLQITSGLTQDDTWVDVLKVNADANWNMKLSQYHDVGTYISYVLRQRWNSLDYDSIGFHAGNVGIGTTLPSYQLSVNGTIHSANSLAPAGISTFVTKQDSKILLYDYGAVNWAGIGADTGGRMWFKAGTTGYGAYTTISSVGNVGIGSSNPASSLVVDLVTGTPTLYQLFHISGGVPVQNGGTTLSLPGDVTFGGEFWSLNPHYPRPCDIIITYDNANTTDNMLVYFYLFGLATQPGLNTETSSTGYAQFNLYDNETTAMHIKPQGAGALRVVNVQWVPKDSRVEIRGNSLDVTSDPSSNDYAQLEIISASAAYASVPGNLQIGYDHRPGTWGCGFLQTVVDFLQTSPLVLNPRGGTVGIGTTSTGGYDLGVYNPNGVGHHWTTGSNSTGTHILGSVATNPTVRKANYYVGNTSFINEPGTSPGVILYQPNLAITPNAMYGGAMWATGNAPHQPTLYGGDLVLYGGDINASGNDGTGAAVYAAGHTYIQGGVAFVGGQVAPNNAATYNGNVYFQTGANTPLVNTDTNRYIRMSIWVGGSVNVGGTNTKPASKFNVELSSPTGGGNTGTWDETYVTIGGHGSTSSALAFGCDTTSTASTYIVSLAPGVHWKPHTNLANYWYWIYGATTLMTLDNVGNLNVAGAYSTSDDRIKTSEEYLTSATDTLLKLKPQKYKKHNFEFVEVSNELYDSSEGSQILVKGAVSNVWVNKEDLVLDPVSNAWYERTVSVDYNEEAGLIAQDIWYDVPELRYIVKVSKDAMIKESRDVSDDPQMDPDYSDWGKNNASVNYISLIPYLIKSIQELHARVEALENA